MAISLFFLWPAALIANKPSEASENLGDKAPWKATNTCILTLIFIMRGLTTNFHRNTGFNNIVRSRHRGRAYCQRQIQVVRPYLHA